MTAVTVAPWAWLGPRFRLFATPADEPRARRASDATVLVGSAALLVATSFAAFPPPGFLRALERFLASFPGFLTAAWQVLADVLLVWAATLFIAAIVRRRGPIVRDLFLAAVLTMAMWLIVERIVEGSWSGVWDAMRAAEPPPWYPALRLAFPAAIVMTASPHLTRPMRRLGYWLFVAAAVAVTVLGATSALGAVAGLLVATVASAAVHLSLGSSGGRPPLDIVEAALADLGVRTRSLGAADRQQAGYFLVDAIGADGEQLVVKVYGRDAHDTAVLSTLWRTVWYRDAGSPLRFGRHQQVEHEAFLTLLAGQAGVRTDTVVTAGVAANDDAVLVLIRDGELLANVDTESVDEEFVRRIWELVGRLHERGIAHGQVDTGHLLVSGDEVGLVDFRGSALARTETQRRTDEAQALVTSVQLLGEERAIAVALDAVGSERMAGLLPFLQRPALTASQRAAGLDIDELRDSLAVAAGVEAPALQQLRRVSLGSILRVLLPALAVIALISVASGLDFGQLGELLRDASWWLLAVGLVVAQLPRVTQAVSTLGASPVPLPLGPVYALQLAVSYVNIAIPTAAARVAVNIRFFQRHGVPPGAALAAGALDGFIGFIVQALILASLLLFTSASLEVDVGSAAGGAGRLLVWMLIVAAVALVVVVIVPRLRRWLVDWARRLGAEAVQAVRGLQSPRRLGLLFGGSLATEVLFAAALGTFVYAFGFRVGIGELLLINISTALLAGLLPVPGGVGVVEGGLIYGLVRAGVPEEVAFAAVVLYRIASFYLPPVWGYFAMRWLERNEHL
jgi:glycosyltransferase 2 family protein